jgi:hypothetical protein
MSKCKGEIRILRIQGRVKAGYAQRRGALFRIQGNGGSPTGRLARQKQDPEFAMLTGVLYLATAQITDL